MKKIVIGVMTVLLILTTGCTSKPKTEEEKIRAQVDQFFRAIEDGDAFAVWDQLGGSENEFAEIVQTMFIDDVDAVNRVKEDDELKEILSNVVSVIFKELIVDYSMGKVSISDDGNEAEVEITIRYRDLESMDFDEFTNLISEEDSQKFFIENAGLLFSEDESSKAKLIVLFLDFFKDSFAEFLKKAEIVESTTPLKLEKVEGQWKIQSILGDEIENDDIESKPATLGDLDSVQSQIKVVVDQELSPLFSGDVQELEDSVFIDALDIFEEDINQIAQDLVENFDIKDPVLIEEIDNKVNEKMYTTLDVLLDSYEIEDITVDENENTAEVIVRVVMKDFSGIKIEENEVLQKELEEFMMSNFLVLMSLGSEEESERADGLLLILDFMFDKVVEVIEEEDSISTKQTIPLYYSDGKWMIKDDTY